MNDRGSLNPHSVEGISATGEADAIAQAPVDPAGPPSRGRLLLSLLLILLACVGVRTWLIAGAQLISRDGVTYVKMAREWSADPAAVVHNYRYHVGYPAAISAMHRVLVAIGLGDGLDGWELSARLVSLLAATLAMVAVWLFAAIAFDWRIALITALMLAVARKWAVLGADVMSDALALAFQLWAVLLTLLALAQLKRSSPRAVLLAIAVGLCAGAGYLVRPESLVVVGLAVAIWLAQQFRTPALRWRLTTAAVLAALFTALACAAPYMLAIGTLTKKKRIDQVVPVASVFYPAVVNSYESGLRELINQLAEAMHPALFFLALGWLVLWSGFRIMNFGRRKVFNPAPQPAGATIMLLTAAAMVPLLLGLHANVRYLNYRHTMLLALLLSPLAGAGLVLAGYLVCDLLHRSSTTFRNRMAYPMLALVAGGMLTDAIQPMKGGQLHYRRAGEQLARIVRPDDYVLARNPWIFHYSQAKGEPYYTEGLTPQMLLERIARRAPAPTHLVFSGDDLRLADPGLPAMLQPPLFQELHRFDPAEAKSTDSVYIYRINRVALPTQPATR